MPKNRLSPTDPVEQPLIEHWIKRKCEPINRRALFSRPTWFEEPEIEQKLQANDRYHPSRLIEEK